MRVPVPNALGTTAEKNNGSYRLTGVTWFFWSTGTEYTYFYETGKKWSTADIEVVKNPDFSFVHEIDDFLLQDGFLKEKGYPIKGRGYVNGLSVINGKLAADIILTDKYLAHVYAECDETGRYIEDGTVYVPPNWDAEEKRLSIILSLHRNIPVVCRKM